MDVSVAAAAGRVDEGVVFVLVDGQSPAAGIQLGEEARVLPHAPIKMIIIDDWAATMPLRPELKGMTSIRAGLQAALLGWCVRGADRSQ